MRWNIWVVGIPQWLYFRKDLNSLFRDKSYVWENAFIVSEGSRTLFVVIVVVVIKYYWLEVADCEKPCWCFSWFVSSVGMNRLFSHDTVTVAFHMCLNGLKTAVYLKNSKSVGYYMLFFPGTRYEKNRAFRFFWLVKYFMTDVNF